MGGFSNGTAATPDDDMQNEHGPGMEQVGRSDAKGSYSNTSASTTEQQAGQTKLPGTLI